MHIMFLRETNPEKDRRFRDHWESVRYSNKKSSSSRAKLYEYKLEALRFPEENLNDVVDDLVSKFGMGDDEKGVRTDEQIEKGKKKVKFGLMKKILFKMIPGLEKYKIPEEMKKKRIGKKRKAKDKVGRVRLLGIIRDKYVGGTEQI